MGSLFRSEEMSLLRLYFERGAAHATVDELGRLGLVQFSDLNAGTAAFARTFSGNVRLCEEMMRRVRLVRGVMETCDVAVPEVVLEGGVGSGRLDVLDENLKGLERDLVAMGAYYEGLMARKSELVELRYVLEKGGVFFGEAPRVQAASYGSVGLLGGTEGAFGGGASGGEEGLPLIDDGGERAGVSARERGTLLSYYAGVVEKKRVPAFERVLFRATRGNCFVRFAEIPEPLVDSATGDDVFKSAFMVFFSGTEVKAKVSKICSAFGAHCYPFPEAPEDQSRAYQNCCELLADIQTVISSTVETRRGMLEAVAQDVSMWEEKVRREKAIYHTLNLLNFDTSNALFIAEVWAPSYALEDVRASLNAGRQRSHAQVPSILEEKAIGKATPPTYFRVNKFTEVFQAIVESYGVAEYQEVNPAPFTVITFPFLFAVMFGDIGHGLAMFLFALYVVLNEKRMVRKKLGEFMQTCYDGRYMLLLMGIFSIFTGFIYNEFFAVPLNLFTSRWKFTAESTMACGIDNCDDAAAVLAPISPYPFGFDPVWKGSSTGLVFFNSYKMKLSIVMGVAQMVMGICMSYLNAKHFKHPLDVWHVFVPQMIFMNAIFGYLVFIILLKWSINWDSPACRADPNCLAPDLKTVLIGMFMSPGNLPEVGRLFPGQNVIQVLLVCAALVAVPWMLFPKPLILKARYDQKKKDAYRPLVDEGEATELLTGGPASPAAGVGGSGGGDDHGHDDDDEFDFSDMFVNQMIHTIEFVLGAVSNTASYLRLWALSLAHAELSDVFLEKLLYMTIESGSTVLMVVGFFMWVGLTLGVLMFMESLSAFLHALRLHWVEFQNKFYNLHGDGKKFVAFDYKALAEAEDN